MDHRRPGIDLVSPDELVGLRRRPAGASQACGPHMTVVPRGVRSGPGPLSYAQERLWLLHEMAPDSPVYNIPVTIHFQGVLDLSALERSIAGLIRRHEVLRTTFRTRAGEPFSVVGSVAAVSLPLTDLREYPSEVREQRFLHLAAEALGTPFDLATGPLIRGVLFSFTDHDHRLHLVLHHIIADGWSLEIIVREIRGGYAAEVAGQSPPPDPPIQYADFALWQRRLVEAGALQPDLDWWKERLIDIPTSLELPVDHPRRAAYSFAGATQFFTLAPPLALALRSLAQRENVTAFMLLLAAFKVLLHRYTGRTDICVGTAIANRTKAELEGLIGCFVNPLILRTEVTGAMTFVSLLRRIRDVTLDAYAHQDVPFEHLVQAMQPDRSRAQNPLFQVLFAFQNTPAFDPGDVGYDPSGEPVLGTAKFELSVALVESGDRLSGAIEYSTDLFEHDSIKRLVGHYRRLLLAIPENPSCPVSTLPLLTDPEIRQIESGSGIVSGPRPACAQELFEEQARRTPDVVAVVAGEQRITYRALDERANQLAHHLRALGVRQGARVGLCLDRSIDLVIAIYAVLKSGGAYVPIDPTYPRDRITLMLDDSNVSVIIVKSDQLGMIGEASAAVLLLDEANAAIDAEPCHPPAIVIGENDLIYVIYTSGSTGRPKAAAVTHRGFVNMLRWFLDDFQMGCGDRILAVTSLSFDLTQKNYFAALAVGGTLHLAPAGLFDSDEVLRIIRADRITLLNCTPSMMYALIESGSASLPALETLRHTFLGGEPIDVGRLSPWIASRFFLGDIVNTYGPTECADITTFHRLESFERYRERPVPIGRPIPNTEALVLDASLNRVPFGVVGELYIGGAGLGPGYINDAGLTAEKFLPHPYARAPGQRLYRSGDLVRQRADGLLEFVGRTDHQLKLRGIRIELGEIEAVLGQHPAVRAIAASASTDADRERTLVAYVVPEADVAGPVLNAARLRKEGRGVDREPWELPNGLAVFHHNRSETEFVYRELFEEGGCLRHGPPLDPGACIFDVGANVGLFALYAALHCPRARIFAFEPIPPVFDTLQLNTRLYALDATLFDCGLASVEGSAMFSYYPNATILSGRFADEKDDREAVRHYLVAHQEETAESLDEVDLSDILDRRLGIQQFACRTRTLSQVIRETGVDRIDLLKVDVEKSELDVLLGIEPGHWGLVQHIVVEVHDIDGRLNRVRHLLEDAGFRLVVEQDVLLRATNIVSVHGWRESGRPPAEGTSLALPQWSSADRLAKDLIALARRSLPPYMVPARVVFVDALPLTPSGKVDRQKLPDPNSSPSSGRGFVAPRTEFEQEIADIWAEVLQLKGLGVRDNFFDLGGHSLLATRIVARMRDRFKVDFPLRRLFERPTIEGLAIGLAESLLESDAGSKAGSNR